MFTVEEESRIYVTLNEDDCPEKEHGPIGHMVIH